MNRPVVSAATLFAAAMLLLPAEAHAQVGGVFIDAEGMLKHTATLAPQEKLKLLQREAVGKPGSPSLASGGTLRKVSLKRLEAAVAAAHKAGRELPPELRYLSGLTRVDYVFFDEKRGDVILAGPAEGWKQLETGEVVGAKSGRPVLHLDDLVAALRYAFAQRRQWAFIGCSIDPSEQGVKRFAAYMRRLNGVDRSRLKQILAGMEQAMGPQDVQIFGVDESSRFALVLLAADYRLKRLAMGHDRAPVKQVVSYLDLAARRTVASRQPQHRWWFVAEYDAIHHTADKLGYQLVGQGVKMNTARAFVEKKDDKPDRPRAAPAATELCESVTKHFPKLSQHIPVFAELENVVGLAVAAELIAARRREGERRETAGESAADAGWTPSHFLNAGDCPIRKYAVPKTTPSLASIRQARGRRWIISVSGGVEIVPSQLVEKSAKPAPESSRLPKTHAALKIPAKPDRWWWD